MDMDLNILRVNLKIKKKRKQIPIILLVSYSLLFGSIFYLCIGHSPPSSVWYKQPDVFKIWSGMAMWMSGCELIEYARVVHHFQYRGKRACPEF